MSARDRIALMVVLSAAALGAAWFFAVSPKRQDAAALTEQVVEAQARRDDANARAATAEQARATYSRDYATVARLGKAVPPRADVASLVFQLETAARAAKVDFRSVTVEDAPTIAPVAPAPAASASDTGGSATAPDAPAQDTTTVTPVPKPDVQPRPFTFSFEGDYLGLRRLLSAIDRFSRTANGSVTVSGRLLTVDSVTMTAGRDGLPQVKAEVVAKAYVADLPAAPTTGASPLAAAAPASVSSKVMP
jgi:hypothetical protein